MTVAGFYSAKTHRVCQVSDCSIQDSTFSSIVEFVLSFMNGKGIPPYSEEEGTGLVRHVYLRRGRVTDQAMLCLVLTKDAFPYEIEFSREIKARFPSIKTLAFNINPNNTNVILGEEERLLFGNGRIDEVLLEKTFSLSFRSFFQVNRDGAELLYRTAFSAVDFNQHDVIVDLYCGIGTIGLTVPAESDLLGVEIVPEAVRDAENNAQRNGRENADFICGDSAKCFQTVKEKQYKNPLVIVDPPRKGLSTDLILQFVQSEIGTILYISCNPETLARDLALFQKNGYAIADIQPVDLFPRTSHVESVVCLTRK